MSESITITRHEFQQMRKDLAYLADTVRALMSNRKPAAWVPQSEAMELIGCKERTLRRLRLNGDLHWRTAGKGRCVMVHRKSIEEYIEKNSTLLKAV